MSGRSYRSVGVLARGGMGTVELVVRSEGRFRRAYALKRLLPAHRTDPQLHEMFVEEARLAGLIRHPNVVSVLDVGEDGEGPFLVMELVEGVSLAKLVGTAREAPLPLAICLEIAVQIAEGLRAAHELTSPEGEHLRLIHRDLSPSNVLIGFDGCARITDFGIAKAAGQSIHTSTGILKGKPSYMSPEQLRFEEIDQRSDFFSLGLLLFEMLSGRRVYRSDGDFAATARRILHEPPPDIAEVRPEVPSSLTELLFELMAKTPADRPSSTAEIAARLRAILHEVIDDEEPVPLARFLETRFGAERAAQQARESRALTESEPVKLEPVRSRWPLYGALALLVALLVAGGAAGALAVVGLPAVGAEGDERSRASPPEPSPEVRPSAPSPPPADLTSSGELPSVEAEAAAPVIEPSPSDSEPRPARREHARESSRSRAPPKRRSIPRWQWPDP